MATKKRSMASIDAEFGSQEERDEWIEEQKRLQKEGKPPFRFNHTPTEADVIRSEKKDMRAYDEWVNGVRKAQADGTRNEYKKRSENPDLVAARLRLKSRLAESKKRSEEKRKRIQGQIEEESGQRWQRIAEEDAAKRNRGKKGG